MSFVNVFQISVCVSFPIGFENGIQALIVLVLDHCLSFYFDLLMTIVGILLPLLQELLLLPVVPLK